MHLKQPTYRLSRGEFVKRLSTQPAWDIIIIGGGATGLGIATDAANRGYSTLLLEQADFAKGTSSRSTKLVHGGVRYLAKGDIRLVYHALDERSILLQNASHLVKPQSFIIPCYSWLSTLKYIIGLKLYDWLSGRFSFGSSRLLSNNKVVRLLPNISTANLKAGIEYFDGQFDDARLAINLAQTCVEQGGTVINYCKVIGFKKTGNKITGVIATDIETNKKFELQAKVVINATGIFVDEILRLDEPARQSLVRPSQGVHLVLNQSFLKSNTAIMIPKTRDGRVLFAVPWLQHVLIGTTDTPVSKNSLEPVALEQEIDFILETVKEYVTVAPTRKDVLSVFAGLRPLAADGKKNATKEISRDHKLLVNDSGLITITGGKWTTYRRMAEETLQKAIQVGALQARPCATKKLKIHGCASPDYTDHLSAYGTDAVMIKKLLQEEPLLNKKLVEHLPYTEAEVVWSIRYEMARTPEDVLARRLRILFLDTLAAIEAAPKVAGLVAKELGYSKDWEEKQVADFCKLAHHYLPTHPHAKNEINTITDGKVYSGN